MTAAAYGPASDRGPRAGGAAADDLPGRDAPDLALLDRVADAALRRIAALRARFVLPADVTTTADPDLTLKPLGELAESAGLIAARHPLPGVRARAADLLEFAWRESRGGELFRDLVRGEPQATYPVEIYASFARAGLRNARAEELMATTTRLRSWRVARGDHTRTLAVLSAEARIGLPPHARFPDVLARTGLGLRSEPWALDRRAAYGLTHDVFHVTDWGRARDRLPPEAADYLRLWLPAWLETWLDEQVWDLAGELLAVAACLPEPVHDAAAWRRFAAAQLPDGGVPEAGTPPHDADPFTSCYHSTLVAAFAATLARTAAEDSPVVGRRSELSGALHGERPGELPGESEVTP